MSVYLEQLPANDAITVIGYDPERDFEKPVRIETVSGPMTTSLDLTREEAEQLLGHLSQALAHASGQQSIKLS